jgi:hypothetical protein
MRLMYEQKNLPHFDAFRCTITHAGSFVMSLRGVLVRFMMSNLRYRT